MRDYEKYDYLYAIIKKKSSVKLKECYGAFGWEVLSREDDERYGDVLHVSFRRPHMIAHKDDLQLMQVYMESALNDLGKTERYAHKKTVIATLSACLFTLGLIAAGVCLILFLNGIAPLIGGVAAFAAAIASAVTFGILVHRLYKREDAAARRAVKIKLVEIKELCRKAKALTEADDA